MRVLHAMPRAGSASGRGARLLLLVTGLFAFPAPAPAQLASDLEAFEQRIATAVKQVAPSVVALSIEREASGTMRPDRPAGLVPSQADEWLRLLLYRRPTRVQVSGVIASRKGHVLTTYTHLRGKLRRIAVRLPDGKDRKAELVGFDQRRDLALVRADLPDPVVPVFASDLPKVGDWVVAVGRVPDPAEPTATTGIVSARRRMRGAAVQIDAELNYGNAGGAVVNLDGKLLGIACNITERAQWGQNSGVGFAVTWDRVEDLLPRLRDGLKSAVPPRPYIGVRPAEGALDVKGAAIDEVIPGGPAAAAGLRDGDLILRVDDQTIRNWGDLVRAIRKHKVGDEIRITVDRLGEKKVFRVTIGQLDHE